MHFLDPEIRRNSAEDQEIRPNPPEFRGIRCLGLGIMGEKIPNFSRILFYFLNHYFPRFLAFLALFWKFRIGRIRPISPEFLFFSYADRENSAESHRVPAEIRKSHGSVAPLYSISKLN